MDANGVSACLQQARDVIADIVDPLVKTRQRGGKHPVVGLLPIDVEFMVSDRRDMDDGAGRGVAKFQVADEPQVFGDRDGLLGLRIVAIGDLWALPSGYLQ